MFINWLRRDSTRQKCREKPPLGHEVNVYARVCMRASEQDSLHTRGRHTHTWVLFVRNIATDLNVMKYKRCHLILDAR